ncbi:uncharacterized protein NECHADRAFT_75222 [Fusarium vanettenii 77-13-4]|uniref:Uncharacterized protein n=1 Tax=Fusarium vanettenii (strain ATCC MYA-4622 / CBS 123669 / FGSC 9596 / NRRL 45880 / 77-13-4) TaxID=660122 RepID=C7YI76_FUSV7|nr:uncharacterized protein NECHADRAFT_75222 [Fusarium vanettenii 77-13-4]EEU48051.1 predicted protein [Fusarium vanettenii 77-13-4]
MATPPTDQEAYFISTCNRILETTEQILEQSAKGFECLDRLLALKLSHPNIFSEEDDAKLKAVKRESDEKKTELQDNINKTRQMFLEPSPDYFREFGPDFDPLKIEEHLNRGRQDTHEWNEKLLAAERIVRANNPQIEELQKIHSDDKDAATQTETNVEKTPTSSGN